MPDIPPDKCRLPSALWRAMTGIGLQPSAVLRLAGLPATLYQTQDGHVTTDQYFALWRAVEQLHNGEGLGLSLVSQTDSASHPPSSLSAFYAVNYRDGLHRLRRYKRLCTPEVLSLVEDKTECLATTAWPHASEPEPGIVSDITFATLVELGRRGTGRAIRPIKVDLTRPKPSKPVYEEFFDCEMDYEASTNALHLHESDLDLPFPGHNPELLEVLTPALAAALRVSEPGESIRRQVKGILYRMLASGRPELTDVAFEMGVSDRTLQRRITEEGTSFRVLLAEARKELGHKLLLDPAIGNDEIAFLLGYQDTTSFYRAFREWEGLTPSEWRQARGARPT